MNIERYGWGFDFDFNIGRYCFVVWFAPHLPWRGPTSWRKLTVTVFRHPKAA